MTEQHHKVTADIRIMLKDHVTGRKVAHYYTVALEKPNAMKSEILEAWPEELIYIEEDVKPQTSMTKYLNLTVNKCRLIPQSNGSVVYLRVIEEGSSDEG